MTDAVPLPEAIVQHLASVLPPGSARTLRVLCELIAASEPTLDATIKWSAPSYAVAGRDVLTTGVNRDGSIRLVLHRGAAKAAAGAARPAIHDPEGLLEWRGVDRAIATFADEGTVRERAAATSELVRQWVASAASE